MLAEDESNYPHRIRASADVHAWLKAMTPEQRGEIVSAAWEADRPKRHVAAREKRNDRIRHEFQRGLWVTARECAAHWGISESTVSRLVGDMRASERDEQLKTVVCELWPELEALSIAKMAEFVQPIMLERYGDLRRPAKLQGPLKRISDMILKPKKYHPDVKNFPSAVIERQRRRQKVSGR